MGDFRMTTLTVGNEGEYRSIGAAVGAAGAGDVIEIGAGVYRETVKLEKRLTLIGQPGAIIDGGWNGQTVEGDFGGVVGCAAPGVVVEGLTIRNAPGRGIGISPRT